jgi:hypothetical protein
MMDSDGTEAQGWYQDVFFTQAGDFACMPVPLSTCSTFEIELHIPKTDIVSAAQSRRRKAISKLPI